MCQKNLIVDFSKMGGTTNFMHGTCQIDVTCILKLVCDIMSQNKEECEKYNKILFKALLFVVHFFGRGQTLILSHIIGVLSLVSFY